jgi:hypothetical protein
MAGGTRLQKVKWKGRTWVLHHHGYCFRGAETHIGPYGGACPNCSSKRPGHAFETPEGDHRCYWEKLPVKRKKKSKPKAKPVAASEVLGHALGFEQQQFEEVQSVRTAAIRILTLGSA